MEIVVYEIFFIALLSKVCGIIYVVFFQITRTEIFVDRI